MRRYSVKVGAVNVNDITSDGEVRISAWPYYLIIFYIRGYVLFSSILLLDGILTRVCPSSFQAISLITFPIPLGVQ